MMNVSDIKTLYRYNEWANERLFTAIAKLSDEDIARDLGGSLPSLRHVVAHIVSTEWSWLERWHGMSPAARSGWIDADLASIMVQSREIEAKRTLYLDSLSDGALASPLSFTYLSGKPDQHILQDLLVHVANHSTYHRGQITLMFRQLGHAPPSTDFVLFKSENR